MTILITGITGFVGKALMQKLLLTEHHLVLLTRGNKETLEPNAQTTWISTCETDWKKMVKQSQPQIVIHLAACLSSADDEKTIDQLLSSNIAFGTHVLDALRGTPVQCFVNTGSFAEYADPLQQSPVPAYLYAATKTAFRDILNYYQGVGDFRIVNVIPYTIYGGADSRKKIINLIYDSTLGNETVNLSPGEQILDFIHINDITDLYCAVITQYEGFKNAYSEIHAGTGMGASPRMVATWIEETTGRKTNIAWGGVSYRPNDTLYAVAQIKAPDFLHWQPVITAENGIKAYIATLETQRNGI